MLRVVGGVCEGEAGRGRAEGRDPGRAFVWAESLGHWTGTPERPCETGLCIKCLRVRTSSTGRARFGLECVFLVRTFASETGNPSTYEGFYLRIFVLTWWDAGLAPRKHAKKYPLDGFSCRRVRRNTHSTYFLARPSLERPHRSRIRPPPYPSSASSSPSVMRCSPSSSRSRAKTPVPGRSRPVKVPS